MFVGLLRGTVLRICACLFSGTNRRLAKARECAVLCFAHVTNQMGRIEGDFEKGVADGAEESLRVIVLAGANWKAMRNDNESL